jgi:hypothetical protein
MSYDNQVDVQGGILYFNIHVLFVNADNPSADSEILAPFEYDVHAYYLAPGPYTDPPVLADLIGHRLGLKNGQGCTFRVPCRDAFWLVFATKVSTYPGDPWEGTTKTSMFGTGNVQPETAYFGYLKFHLLSP